RVRHSRHRNMLVVLPAARPGRLRSRNAARKLVLQVAAKYTVLNQDVLLCRIAFIIDVERAASIANRSVIDDRAKRTPDLLTDTIAEGRYALSIEVRFKSVTNSFVK